MVSMMACELSLPYAARLILDVDGVSAAQAKGATTTAAAEWAAGDIKAKARHDVACPLPWEPSGQDLGECNIYWE